MIIMMIIIINVLTRSGLVLFTEDSFVSLVTNLYNKKGMFLNSALSYNVSEKITGKRQNHSFLSNKYTCQVFIIVFAVIFIPSFYIFLFLCFTQLAGISYC